MPTFTHKVDPIKIPPPPKSHVSLAWVTAAIILLDDTLVVCKLPIDYSLDHVEDPFNTPLLENQGYKALAFHNSNIYILLIFFRQWPNLNLAVPEIEGWPGRNMLYLGKLDFTLLVSLEIVLSGLILLC